MKTKVVTKKLSGISVVLPAYNDEHTIPVLVNKAAKTLPGLAVKFEIVVVNDASCDNTKDVLLRLQDQLHFLKVITHKKNKGYGATIADGFHKAKHKFIFYTDGDGQYDVTQLKKLVQRMDNKTDMVTGFKKNRSDPWYRSVIGRIYSSSMRILLSLPVKDVDCDFRLFRKSLIRKHPVFPTSGAFDAAFLKFLSKKSARIREVEVIHYKRKYGTSQIFKPFRIYQSLRDIFFILKQSYI